MKNTTGREIARAIEDVKATMAIEGLDLSERSIIYGKMYLKGELTSDEATENITKYIKSKMRKR